MCLTAFCGFPVFCSFTFAIPVGLSLLLVCHSRRESATEERLLKQNPCASSMMMLFLPIEPSPISLQKLEPLGEISQIPYGNDKPVGVTNQQCFGSKQAFGTYGV